MSDLNQKLIRKFFLDNKTLIDSNNFKEVVKNLTAIYPLPCSNKIKEILEKAGVPLINYSLFEINDKVEVISPNYTYEIYDEFFDENNLPVSYKENYMNSKPTLKSGDVGIVLAKGFHSDMPDLLYVIGVEKPTSTFIYLISQDGLKLYT